MAENPSENPIRVDIVSDVVCPWCIVGFLQLRAAAHAAKIPCQAYWHPFELNPQMPAGGQDMAEHLTEKYGTTPEQSANVRNRLTTMAAAYGFTFNFDGKPRMHNTFLAHQALRFAGLIGRTHALKMALFKAHFTDQRPIGEIGELCDIAATEGLNAQTLRDALENGTYASDVRDEEKAWVDEGITGVPAMIFERRFLVSGAQGEEAFANILQRVAMARAA